MSPLRKAFARVMACGTSLIVVATSCDRACSSGAATLAASVTTLGREAGIAIEPPRVEPAFVAVEPDGFEPFTAYGPTNYYPDDPPTPEPPKPLRPTQLDGLSIPDVHTAEPTSAEWLAAKPLDTTHPDCKARLVREWMTLQCTISDGWKTPSGFVRVLAGGASEVSTWSFTPKPPTPAPNEYATMIASTVAAVFPVRRGDRRLLELLYLERGRNATFDHTEAFTISVAWLEGMESPDVTITD